jgi:hypothetical protein
VSQPNLGLFVLIVNTCTALHSTLEALLYHLVKYKKRANTSPVHQLTQLANDVVSVSLTRMNVGTYTSILSITPCGFLARPMSSLF